ncbi:MAG: hypothetical protein JNM07_09840 [Phycisphaerae bacterium]|nr:hypothetical protein [Phycisphaerae bacterium]
MRYGRAGAGVVLLCAWISLTTALTRAGPPIGIADVSPPDSYLVLAVDDWATLRRAFEESDLGALAAEPSVRTFVVSMLEESRLGAAELTGSRGLVEEWLKADGLKWADLAPPQGPAGMSLHLAPRTPGARGSSVRSVVLADFGTEGDRMRELAERLSDRAARQKLLTFDDREHNGVEVRTLTPTRSGGADTDLPPPIAFAFVGSVMLASNDPSSLDAAIDRLKGERIACVGERAEYESAVNAHPGALIHAVLLPTAVLAATAEAINADASRGALKGSAAAAAGLVDALGITQVRTVSLGLFLGGDDEVARITVEANVPEKRGLFRLLDESGARPDPPAFVGADADGVLMLRVRFDRMVEVARALARGSLSPDEAGRAEQQLAGFEQVLGPLLKSAGPEVTYATESERPFSLDSTRTILGIRLSDTGPLTQLLALFGPQIGAKPRDFEGNTIHEVATLPVNFALGLGFDTAFLAPARDIENAMRRSGRPGTPRLSSEVRYVRAAAHMAGEGVLFSYSDTRQTLEHLYWSAANYEVLSRSMMAAEAELEPDESDSETSQPPPKWMSALPPIELLLGHIGDATADLAATPGGYRGKLVMLKARKD